MPTPDNHAESDRIIVEQTETRAVLEISDLRKTFVGRGERGSVAAVDGISLNVLPGEMIVLLGPSGCGKTTLLRCVAGLETPDEGTIRVGGNVVFSSMKRKDLPPERRSLSMMFQSYALWPHMTAEANVAYPLQSRHVDRATVSSRVEEALEAVGIPYLANEHPHAMSGGQQQRVALARALVAGTPLILFDEPLSNVDAKVRDDLILEIRRMQERFSFAGLYVTHDQSEALALGDRIVVLDSGKVVEVGSPRKVYHAPDSRYAARFVGASNEFTGLASQQGDATAVKTDIGTVFSGRASAGQATGKVSVVFRPNDCRIRTDSPAEGAENTWSGIVEAVTFRGAMVELLVAIGDQHIKVSLDSREDVRQGAPVTVSVDPADVLVFSAE